jgi:hypothetical protein
MKLLSIHLHPFGGIANRTCTLHDGINVVEGPNEFGKSTLSNALWHALFTATNLTPAAMRNTMGRWYPRPAGDHAAVTLKFHADGCEWTLKKTWGAGAASNLQSDGSANIAAPSDVQAHLLTFLRRNEATWRYVLFTGQAQLAATVEQLRGNSKSVSAVEPLLAGAAAIPGDIPPDKLATALDSRITAHFGCWDRSTDQPKPGRSIDNPWQKGVGPLLAAYYGQETLRIKLADVIKHEQAVDALNAQIYRIAGDMSADEDFVRTGRTLRDGLGKRVGLDERCQRLTGELRLLKDIMIAWPGAAQVIQGKETELTGVSKDLESLEAELMSARKRSQAEQLRLAHDRLTKARDEWQRVANILAQSKAVPAEPVAELKRLEKEIETLRITIAAQKLTAKLESAIALSVKVQRGTQAPEVISLSPSTAWENQADGLFRLEFQDLKLCVESGTGDVQALFAKLESASQRQAEILTTLGHESLAAVQMAGADHQKRITEESTAKGLYSAALQGRSTEVWAADMAALAGLPETRSVDVLESERARQLARKATLDIGIQQERKRIETWAKDHVDVESLTDKILSQTAAANQAKQELAGLPELPAGFTSVHAYLELLSSKEAARENNDQRLSNLKLEQATLLGAAPDSTAEELRSELESKQRDFVRQQGSGEALLRIQAKLQSVIAARGTADPMQGFATTVSSYFESLTGGRYPSVTLAGIAPISVGGAIALDIPLLSQGTLGSLALATRLALSELYLKEMDGFFLLDDPFTDMDNSRRAAAVQALGTFAKKHQVLLFTCHPDHARELESLAGAKIPSLTDIRN